MIPMVDLKAQYHALKAEIDAAVEEVLESGRYILGPHGDALELELADTLGSPHAVACASGTDALHLALRAAGIGPGDEVITTPFTFIATAEAIRYVGATSVFVDIDPHTFNIDVAAIEAAITPRTRCVLPVHLFGQPADMPAIMALCEARGIRVIEDCAQSFGAAIGGRMTGSIGAFGCFSFFPSKNLGGCGDGGLVATASAEAADALRRLRNHGSQVRYHHDEIGWNSRLDEIQAAILRVKLRHIDRFNRERRRVARRYNELLAGSGAVTPHEDGKGVHVFHQYTLLTDRRERVMHALQQEHIACAIYYPIPLHRQKAFAGMADATRAPVAERVAARCLSLPIYPELSDAQIRTITGVIRQALE
jgi:dTDP-4-amino-4,6-dideoxygalactose transaminase